MATKNNKKNALIGGLLVFMVPLLAVSIVYFSASRLPKGKEIPLLQEASTIGDWKFSHEGDTIQNGTFWKDVKVIFYVDSTNVDQRITALNKITENTKSHPEFSLKDPYGQLYFIAVNSMKNSSFAENLNHWFDVHELENSSVFADQNKLYVLDRDENLRGAYFFSEDDVQKMDFDIQYLLQDTFYANADSLRIKTVFQSPIDEE